VPTPRPPATRPDAAGGAGVEALVSTGEVDWGLWRRTAARLEQSPLPPAVDRSRFTHELFLPVLFWLMRMAGQLAPRPLIAGISAPQGAGKSMLGRLLVPLLEEHGYRACALSIDDFYLTHAEQERLAAAHPGNPYLRYRGYPGTHDVRLGSATLEALRSCPVGAEVRLPRYDKSLHAGRGDRLPAEHWSPVSGPLDIVLVEGWMLGFQPLPPERISDPQLRAPNELLRGYDAWERFIDVLVILRTRDPESIVRWRIEAEESMKASGRPGLDRSAAEDYIRRFLPAYALYAASVTHGWWAPDRQLELVLGPDRLPVPS
jgi:D-glycerate 3-kinase